MRHRLLPSTLLALACAVPVARAAQDDPFSAANALPSAALATYRGGFTTDTGLQVSLGIERLVTVNGNVLEHSDIQLADVGKVATGQAALSGEALGALRLIQNGVGSYTAPFSPNALAGTVIQNSLNDQLIHSQTTINASVNTSGLLQALNFQTSLGNALTNALIQK
jgi:hypothetical protein